MADKSTNAAVRYGEHFNPFEHLSNAQKEDGKPAFETYVLNGVPQMGTAPNGETRMLMVPTYNIDGNSMRDWWWTAYPEGRIETLHHTPNAVYDQEKHKFVYPDEVCEVRLYRNLADEKPFANGFGKAPIVEGGKFPELPSAVTLAFKNAMANAGFGVDLDWDKIRDNAPNFFEVALNEDPSKFIPVVKTVSPEESKPSVKVTEVSEEVVKESQGSEEGKILPGQMMLGVEKSEEEKPAEENTGIDFSSPVFKAMAKAQEEAPVIEIAEVKAEEKKEVNSKLEELLSTIFVSQNRAAFEKYNGKTFKVNLEEDPEDFGGVLERISRARTQYTKIIPVEVLDAIEDYQAIVESSTSQENYLAM